MAMTETKSDSRPGALRAVRGAHSPPPARHADADAASPHADPPAERLAYSVAEAAAITGQSRDPLYDQMRAGKLAYLKVGRRRIITRRNLGAFLARPRS
ncbi:MAG: helix-turn-helix domain-containing protein [Streptosporangiaceae bacterium]